MEYPRLLKLEPEVKQSLVFWLESAITNHMSERSEFIDEIIENQELYWAEPVEVEKKFPFKGAANVIIPLAAIGIETYHSNTMQSLRALSDPISVESVRQDWLEGASVWEKYYNREIKENVNLIDNLEPAIMDIEKQGTGISKTGYEKIVKWGVKETPDGDEVEFPVVVRHGACVHSVPLYRFLMPFSAKDEQSAAWCGEEHEDTIYEISVMEDSGFFYEGVTEKLQRYVSTRGQNEDNKASQRQQELDKRRPNQADSIKWYEICLAFDLEQLENIYDGSSLDAIRQVQGDPKEIVVYYNRDLQEILGVRYNWNFDLRRFYLHGVYFPIEHRWRGIGICKQTKMFQYEVTAQHRQRLDNATIANMRMFKISKMSGYGPGEPIFPGKMWFLDDMDHIDTIQAGEVYASSYNDEVATIQYHQQRIGLGDINFGTTTGGTPGTATDIMARVKESKKRSDYTYGNIRKFVDANQKDILLQIRQFGVARQEFLEVIEGAEWIQKFLTLPPELIRDNLVLRFVLAGEKDSDLVDRNNWTQVAGIFGQYVTGAVELCKLIGNPQLLQQVALKGLVGATLAFKQVGESYKLAGVDQMIVKELIENDIGLRLGIPGISQGSGVAASTAVNANSQAALTNGNSGPPRISPQQLMALANPTGR